MNFATLFRFLKTSLEFADYAVKRGDSVKGTATDPEKWIRQGIQDLDFDPFFFLGTGKTSPEEWAIPKGCKK